MISQLLVSDVLAGAGDKVWHQSGPRELEFPIPGLCDEIIMDQIVDYLYLTNGSQASMIMTPE